METFRTHEAAIAAELASTGEHSPLAGTAGRPDAARIRDGLTLGLKRHVIRACCHVPFRMHHSPAAGRRDRWLAP